MLRRLSYATAASTNISSTSTSDTNVASSRGVALGAYERRGRHACLRRQGPAATLCVHATWIHVSGKPYRATLQRRTHGYGAPNGFAPVQSAMTPTSLSVQYS